MKTKNKKKILPFFILAILLFSIFSSVALAAIGLNRWPVGFRPGAEYDRERLQNSTNTWNGTEYVRDGTIDENWNVSMNATTHQFGWVPTTPWMVNDTKWQLNASYPEYLFNFSLMWNNSTYSRNYAGKMEPRANLTSTFSWAILNNSYFNRTQSIVFARAQNWSWEADGEIYYGVIIKANNSSRNPVGPRLVDTMTAVLFGPNKVYILDYNNSTGVITDTLNGSVIESNVSIGLTNYYNSSWMTNTTLLNNGIDGFSNGTWIKTVYNAPQGYVQSKCWGNTSNLTALNPRLNFLDEPTGWILERNITNLTTIEPVMCGLAVWNPNWCQAVVQFDMYNVWRLNYTVNSSDEQNLSGNRIPRPHMVFPFINATSFNSSFINLIFDKVISNITRNDVADSWLEFSNTMAVESRAYRPREIANPPTEATLQNDTIYYYSGVITRFNDQANDWFGTNPFTGNPDDLFFLWVQDCTASTPTDNSKLFIAIDTDNNRVYNAHDRAFMINRSVSGTTLGSWTGNTSDATTNFWGDVNISRGIDSLHKYNNHTTYMILIPRMELRHSSNASTNYLDENDTFGLLILNENRDYDTNVPVWCNWNETTGNPSTSEINITAMAYFTGTSDINVTDQLEISGDNVERWGEGQIGWLFDETLKGNFSFRVTHSANVTAISNGLNNTTIHLVNYSINITNTGTGNITGIQINMSWIECINGLFNWTWQGLLYNQSNSVGYNNYFNQSNPGAWNFSWNNGSEGGYVLINLSDPGKFTYGNITLSAGAGIFFNVTFTVDMRPCDNDTRTTITTTATVTCDREDVTDSDTHQILWSTTALLRIQARRSVFDIVSTADTVITIVGIVIIIAAILAIIGIVYGTRDMW